MIQGCDLGQYKVRNYLSIAGPQMGCEKPGGCDKGGHLCNMLIYIQNHLDMFSAVQQKLAPSNYLYLSDPKFYPKMLKDEIYLPLINNFKQHALSSQYKQRFSALNRAQFVLF